MGNYCCKKCRVDEKPIQKTDPDTSPKNNEPNDLDRKESVDNKTFTSESGSLDDVTVATVPVQNNYVNIQVDDPQVFNHSLVHQRQQAINNASYRAIIDSWSPNSLQQLADAIRTFSNGKYLVDCHWSIFYWIATNIAYDTVSYFSKNYQDQSAEGVFRTKMGVCAGYGNLYKYLCDQLQIPCKIVGGYSNGYGFDDRESAPVETDHAWNAVEIDGHWYLMESTWGAGHLNKQKVFERALNCYYFLPRPNEMIYHHLPEDEKWQLLRTSIKIEQFMQMPKVHPTYFELNLELVSPVDQAYVDFVPNKSYALVVLRAPSDVHIIADLKLNDQNVIGGHQVIFDRQNKLCYCYFAPNNTGKHKITIYGSRNVAETGLYNAAIDLTLNIKQMPLNPISFPKTWDNFFDLGLEIITPQNTHLIELSNGTTHTEIQIKAPENVDLHGRLKNENQQDIAGGDQVYFDRQRKIWRCFFAPNRDGLFEALIMAKKKSDPGEYTSAILFKIEAKQVPSPPVTYPFTWPPFYDLDLRIEAPRNRSSAVWPENASYAEVLIQAPDDVQISCDIRYHGVKIENGSLAQFDNVKKLCQLLFSPERTGVHELMVYAKRDYNNSPSFDPVVKLFLDVSKLRRPMKFPLLYTQFQTRKCQVYTPLNGILERESVVSIHCVIPGASDISIEVDSQPLGIGGYSNQVLKRQITVGSQDVVIYAKYGQQSRYSALIQYTVR